MNGHPALLGILNITEDSFSDGGRYLAPEAALARAQELLDQGADILDIGAASSRPGATPVPASLEIERLAPVVDALAGARLSVDSFAPETQRWALQQSVGYLNDINGFAHEELYPALADSEAKLIVMHALRQWGPASREDPSPADPFGRILEFFAARIGALVEAGVARDRLILDPGMGFFLGSNPLASFAVLRRIAELKSAFGLPVLVSVSRKSFLRAVTGRSAAKSGAASLAAELFAAAAGADFIRTHDPMALRDGLAVARALEPNAGEAASGTDGRVQKLQQTRENPLL